MSKQAKGPQLERLTSLLNHLQEQEYTYVGYLKTLLVSLTFSQMLPFAALSMALNSVPSIMFSLLYFKILKPSCTPELKEVMLGCFGQRDVQTISLLFLS